MHVHTPINNQSSSAYIPWVYDALLDQVCLNYTANHLVRRAIAPDTTQDLTWGAFAAAALTSGITGQTPADLLKGSTNIFANLYHGAVGAGLNRLFGVKERQDWTSVIATAAGQSIGNIIASELAKVKPQAQATSTINTIKDALAKHPTASEAERKALVQEIIQANEGSIGAGFDVGFDEDQFYFDYRGDKGGRLNVDFGQVTADNIDTIGDSILSYIGEYQGVGSGAILTGMQSVLTRASLTASLNNRYNKHHQARALQQAHNAASVNAFATQQYVHGQTSALYDLVSNVTLGSVLLPVGGAAAGSLARSTFALGQGVWNGGRALVTGIGNTASFTANSMRMGLGSFGQSLGAGITANLPAWSIAGNIGVSGLELATGTEFLPTVNDSWKPGVRFARSTISASSPREIYWGFGDLSRRQQNILEQLPGELSSFAAHKKSIKTTDLAALTATTGDEFALFTNGSQRLIVRGNQNGVRMTRSELIELRQQGYKWSGHSHPGTSDFILNASGNPGDRLVLELFQQKQSLIINSIGQRSLFNQLDDIRIR